MPHYLDPVIAGPSVLAVVGATGLDALSPFRPEVVACGVAAASAGRRSTESVGARLTHRRTRAVHAWVHRLLHRRGGLPLQPQPD
jgi:hypothetical protein